MNEHAQAIHNFLSNHYAAEEWPTLRLQAEQWAATQPLKGLKLLDATPIYRNSLAKFAALLAAGADLYVPARTTMPRNEETARLLPGFGIKTASKEDSFDIILDCAGSCAHFLPETNPNIMLCMAMQSQIRNPQIIIPRWEQQPGNMIQCVS